MQLIFKQRTKFTVCESSSLPHGTLFQKSFEWWWTERQIIFWSALNYAMSDTYGVCQLKKNHFSKSKESKMSSGFVRSHGGKRKGRDTCSLFEEASQSPVFWNCLFFQFLSILFHFLRCCMGALLLHCVISSIWGEKTNVMVFLFYEDSCLKKKKKKRNKQ